MQLNTTTCIHTALAKFLPLTPSGRHFSWACQVLESSSIKLQTREARDQEKGTETSTRGF